jgi:glycosyltransferase involved in cell wall biosynthesis
MEERLVILHTESSEGWGGQEIRVLTEAEDLRDRGHQVAILCRPESALALRARGCGLPVVPDRMPFALDPRTVIRMAAHFRRWRAQVVVTHSSIDSWCAGLAARLTGVPVVRMRHLSVPLRPNPVSRFVYDRLCDRVVTTGEAIRGQFIQRLGLPPTKVTSIPTGVDLGRFDPSRADPMRLRKELDLDGGIPLVAMIGVLRSWKGHLVFLRTMGRIREVRPEVRALFVGDGPFRSVIEDAIRRQGLGDAVHLLGHREDIPEILGGVDVVASASTAAEGIPQALLQALAMRRPVVASDVGGVPEIIRPGETGWLVPADDPDALADAILEVLANPVKAARLGEAGRKVVEERHSLRAMGEQMEELYRAVAAGRRPCSLSPSLSREP